MFLNYPLFCTLSLSLESILCPCLTAGKGCVFLLKLNAYLGSYFYIDVLMCELKITFIVCFV